MKGFQEGTARGFIAAVLLSALFVCMPADAIRAAGKSPNKAYLYVLSSGKRGALRVNTLSLVDANAKTTKELFRLEKGSVETLSRDPYGRFWAGYTSPDGRRENRVQVFSADGSFSKTVLTADNPGAGIIFSGRRAFIACTQNGFSGAIDVFDQNTLTQIKTIELSSGIKKTPYYLTAMACDGKRIAVAGMTTGPVQSLNYCVITVIDCLSLSIIMRTKPLEGVDIWSILPYRGSFIMLNNAFRGKANGNYSGLLVLAGDSRIKEMSGYPSPLMGMIKGDILYTFHNGAFNSTSSEASRKLSILNLRTKKMSVWTLPDNWNCSGMAATGSKILLLNSEAPQRKAGGIYEFSPEDKKLSQMMSITDASRMLSAEQ
jgi:hypothetical protein